ncbi:alpha-glucoside transport system substrate-binding protein [Hamadaea flava]|uniref:ABC transporter substrate-binding protein n=1 Tax=Hamadaea flava TaxID=1742688 RepID=A0ABV8LPH9_9ACTN|nr:alpha-glucoside transport system substrate-binding protein [Hamadaea flava]
MASARRRSFVALVAAAGLTLGGLAACNSGEKSSDNLDKPECAAFKDYTGIAGKTVSVYTSIRDAEADLLQQSWKQWADCTGVKIDYEGNGDFEAQLQVRVQGGNAPDIAFIPQPGLLSKLAKAGNLKPAAEKTQAMATQNYSGDWLKYATVDGKLYGAPLGSNVKSFVWYSPKMFKDKGWTIPTSWDELISLSDKIAATGIKPWCAGIESGSATGWPATDWIEDVLLRDQGPDVYDQWVAHSIPFNDPKIVSAVDKVGSILKNDKYVNGGLGGVKSIATTSFQAGGTPITTGKCALHRQASFYANQWPQGTKVAEDGDVFAFYFPAVDPSKKPVLGAGEFTAIFDDRPEVQAFQTYLASAEHANSRAKLGNWVSANKGLDIANVANPIDKKSVEILKDSSTVFRFDGSDLMPASVGAGSFWKGMTDWINGKSTKDSLDYIENSWPK